MNVRRADFFLIPNILSLMRLLFIPFLLLMVIRENDVMALLLIAAGMATDVADGVIARRLNQISELGKILDPLADKLGTASLAIVLYCFRDFPVWALALIVGRDLLIVLAAIILSRRHHTTPTSNLLGKLTALCYGLLMISYLLPFAIIREVLLVIAAVMTPISLILYLKQATR